MSRTHEIFPRELKEKLDAGLPIVLLDVREPEEIRIAEFPRALHIPMGDVPARISELDPEAEIVVICHHGIRSAQVAGYLMSLGFEKVLNLQGGIDAWSAAVDPAVPRY
jgi:rhodanese-related sulfurtransferase